MTTFYANGTARRRCRRCLMKPADGVLPAVAVRHGASKSWEFVANYPHIRAGTTSRDDISPCRDDTSRSSRKNREKAKRMEENSAAYVVVTRGFARLERFHFS